MSLIVTTTDSEAAGYCASGLMRWFALNGMDIRKFVQHGIEAEELLKTGDERAERIVEVARQRAAREASQ